MTHTNKLLDETSPYLLQHAHNPVHWQPWGAAALQQARDENKPILLSIGYSACHWCHVMAHESFEDEETARLMNEYFVNIKVDREERPDLDKIYQTAHQLLTRRAGGWPLTVFLTPDDHLPFFVGTYFPKRASHGMPSFKDLMGHIHSVFSERMEDIRSQNASLQESMQSLQQSGPSAPNLLLNSQPLDDARRQSEQSYDPHNGGFGQAPKFPHPSSLQRLMRHCAAMALSQQADEKGSDMLLHSLTAMALGGMNDQLGGGFCRYSVDAHWMIPHFEKMLYDNGPLLSLYSEAWQLTGLPLFHKTAVETADWVMREMQSADGGYYSSIDADSEGHEGKFYVWQRDEVKQLISDAQYPLFAYHFGLDSTPNFEGLWHLHIYNSLEQTAEHFKQPLEQVTTLINQARATLLAQRDTRIRPGTDDKILCSWNALMIRGMADAGRILKRADYVQSAQRALNFIQQNMWRDGRLLATSKDGKSHLNAYLDDYAFLLDAILAMLEIRWDSKLLAFATQLADVMLEQFEDKADGGFYFTSHDHEALIQRSKSLEDDALPAGNGVAALSLTRLGHLLGSEDYLHAAENTVRAAWNALAQYPAAHNAMLTALEEQISPPQIIILRGDATELQSWLVRCQQNYAPGRLCFAIPADEGELPAALEIRKAQGGIVAYVCEGVQCGTPVTQMEELEKVLGVREIRGVVGE